MATIDRAIQIAAKVHEGQTDKGGDPYILHPLRMMMKMKTEPERMAAVLHDVVEDCVPEGDWTIHRLRDEGFSESVLKAVDCVTKREGESYEDFVKRGLNSPIAHAVKLADLEDNMNMLRIKELQPKDLERLEKYHRSWHRLTSMVNGG